MTWITCGLTEWHIKYKLDKSIIQIHSLFHMYHCMHTYIHTHHSHTHTTLTHAHAHCCIVCMCACVCVCARTCVCVCVCVCACVHVYVHMSLPSDNTLMDITVRPSATQYNSKEHTCKKYSRTTAILYLKPLKSHRSPNVEFNSIVNPSV